MGQYFHIVNLDKDEYLNPHKFGDGLKLFEFGELTMAGLTLLLAHGAEEYFQKLSPLVGSWAGDRIVIAGDEVDDPGEFLSDEQIRRLRAQPEAAAHLEEFDIDEPSVPLFARFCCRDISEELMFALCDCDLLEEWIDRVTSSNALFSDEYRTAIRRRLKGDTH